MKSPSRIRYLFFKTTAVLLGLSLGLLLMEIGLRTWLFGGDLFHLSKVNSFRPIGNSDYIQYAEDARIFYELKPNLDAWFKLKPLHTNSRGLRDKEYALIKPPTTYRVAVIGDSFTFGDGVAIEEVYHSVLEETLNRVPDSLRYEFINFGVGGYNLGSYLGIMEQKALAYDPDLILIGFCGNNDDEPPGKSYGKRQDKIKKMKWLIHHSQIVRTINEIVKTKRRSWRRAKQTGKAEKMKFVVEHFAKFRTFSEENNIPLLIFYLTMQDAPRGGNAWILKLSAQHGFDFVDSSPAIDEIQDISQFWVHSTDRHPNHEIHGKYAEVLMTYFNQPGEKMTNGKLLFTYQ